MIHGTERRKLKKELSDLRRFTKMFWHFEDIERVYGGGSTDEECLYLLENANARMVAIEQLIKL